MSAQRPRQSNPDHEDLRTGAVGSGLGRYIGGMVPDAAFRSDGSISLIDTTSWVAGVEQTLTDRVSVAGYFSGVNTDGNYSTDRDGHAIGFGYPGSSSSNNRTIRECDGDRRLSDRQDTRSRFGAVQRAGVVADQGAVVDAAERVVVGAIVHVSRAGSLQPAVAPPRSRAVHPSLGDERRAIRKFARS